MKSRRLAELLLCNLRISQIYARFDVLEVLKQLEGSLEAETQMLQVPKFSDPNHLNSSPVSSTSRSSPPLTSAERRFWKERFLKHETNLIKLGENPLTHTHQKHETLFLSLFTEVQELDGALLDHSDSFLEPQKFRTNKHGFTRKPWFHDIVSSNTFCQSTLQWSFPSSSSGSRQIHSSHCLNGIKLATK